MKGQVPAEVRSTTSRLGVNTTHAIATTVLNAAVKKSVKMIYGDFGMDDIIESVDKVLDILL